MMKKLKISFKGVPTDLEHINKNQRFSLFVLSLVILTNRGLVIKALNDLDKHLERQRDLAGRFANTSTMISGGRAAIAFSVS
ncbi:hypothetical protein WN943_015949 [Citrus x changshan-huyou]